MADALSNGLLQLSADIAAAHVGHNKVAVGDVPDLIRSIYATLCTAGSPPAIEVRAEPAVPIKKSVFPGYIVCLEDGKKLLMLKRHLQTAYGLTPDDYRKKWGLPADYPMVAPDYSARRSTLAKGIGLGRKSAPAAELSAASATEPKVVVQQIPERKRGRKPGSKNRQIAPETAAVE